MIKKIFYFFILILMACSSEKSQEGTKLPNVSSGTAQIEFSDNSCKDCSLEIKPGTVSRGSKLLLYTKRFYISSAKIEWIVNGSSQTNSDTYEFNTAALKKGDTVQAIGIIKGVKVLSNIVQISNALPQVDGVKIIPEKNKISVEATGSDADGDAVTLFYEWAKNGKLAGTDSKIEFDLKRGDQITVKITPFDGEGYGQPVVVEREIQNVSPTIIEHKNYSYVGGIFTYKVEATDPNGDTLTYSLKKAPQGMSINPASGLIEWKVPSDFKDKVSFVVAVVDEYKAESILSNTFTVEGID